MDKLLVAGALQQSLSGQSTGYHTEGEAQNTYTWMEGLHPMDQSELGILTGTCTVLQRVRRVVLSPLHPLLCAFLTSALLKLENLPCLIKWPFS